MLCFLQQIDLINNDFYIKTVRTNYCVPFKSITNSHINNKHFFPPPPPLPLHPDVSILPSSRHPLMLTSRSNRSPSPTLSISKFAQVRDKFARAEVVTASIPIKTSTPCLPTIPSLEKTRSPQSLTVLNAVQEYQRQHINNHQPAFKRFTQINNGNRSPNIAALRSRGIAPNNKFPNKPSLPAYVTSSPKQPAKPITRVT
jgi:hypothetical protein